MKGLNKKNESRRDFLKKTTQLALAGCAGATVNANAASEQTTNQPTPKKSAAEIPGSHVRQLPGSKFKGDLKMPGWVPDTTTIGHQYLFLEEAVYMAPRDEGFVAFPTPAAGGQPFAEPLATASASDWSHFNTWILGAPFNKKPQDDFDDLLAGIADSVRKYNAALYWMRRLHMHEKVKLLNPPRRIASAPPHNPHGDLPGGETDPATWNFAELVPAAQENWKIAVNQLKNVLQVTGKFSNVYADFIQVNNYIVSMRVVATLKFNPGEMGGSSSSHVSVSSAFSSS